MGNDSYLRTSRDILRRQQRNRLLHHHRCLRTMPVPRLRSRPAHHYRNQERLPSLRRFHSYPSHCTVIPCATCAALVPGTVTQTGGGKPSAYTVLVPATAAAGTPGQQTPVVT